MVDKSPFDSPNDPDEESDDVSSLEARALKAVLAELRGERTGILGATGVSPPLQSRQERKMSKIWCAAYVMERMEEVFRTLQRVRMRTRPLGFVSSMPLPIHDRGDLNAQLETKEFERMLQRRNRVCIGPSQEEMTRMEEAIWWPTKYLRDAEDLARAVNLSAMWAATDADVDKGLRRIKTTRREFNDRKLRGFCIIAEGLARDRVPIK